MAKFFKDLSMNLFHVIMITVMVVSWIWNVAKRDAAISALQKSDKSIAENVRKMQADSQRDHEAIIRVETRQDGIREDVSDIKRDVKTLVRQIGK